MYDLEIDKVICEIKNAKAKTVLVQLPDGLKPRAKEIKQKLSQTGAKIFFWGGSCFGACDIPSLHNQKFDLLIQFGHSEWKNV